MASKLEPRVLNPDPDGPLRNERELCRLVIEVLIRKEKHLTEQCKHDHPGGVS